MQGVAYSINEEIVEVKLPGGPAPLCGNIGVAERVRVNPFPEDPSAPGRSTLDRRRHVSPTIRSDLFFDTSAGPHRPPE
jgi:hypothetical protein